MLPDTTHHGTLAYHGKHRYPSPNPKSDRRTIMACAYRQASGCAYRQASGCADRQVQRCATASSGGGRGARVTGPA
jgi:hypothetical protein